MLSMQPVSMQTDMNLVAPQTSITYNLKNCKENIDIALIYLYYLATLPKAWQS